MCEDHDHGHGLSALGREQERRPLRVAITGKGGVGKTTLAGALANRLAEDGSVIAIDGDPDMNLARAIGIDDPPAITAERELIEERTGDGGLISLTPEVGDILDSHSTSFGEDGRLLTIGAPGGGDTGCMCSENAFIRSLLSSSLADGPVVMDTEAGIEHLGRGTAGDVDAILVVVEPSLASIETAHRIEELAEDLGIDGIYAILNKTQGERDMIEDHLGLPIIAELPYDSAIAEAGMRGESAIDMSDQLNHVVDSVLERLLQDRLEHNELTT